MKSCNYIMSSLVLLFLFVSPALAKPRLAVLDLDIEKTAVLVTDNFVITGSVDDQTKLLTSELITFLVNTRKFDVMERDRVNAIMKEHQFAQTGVVDQKSAVSIGRMLGVQLVVLGKIEALQLESKETKIPYSDYAVKTTKGNMITNIRVVDVESGVIVAANKVKVAEQVKGEVSTDLFFDTLKEKSARRITGEIINGVFPIRIVGVETQTVFLNYGKGAAQFKVGDELDVFQTGEDMIDPDSGESLGPKESYLGKIRIMAIERKKSIATIIDSAATITVGAICKTAAVSQDNNTQVEKQDKPQGQKVNW